MTTDQNWRLTLGSPLARGWRIYRRFTEPALTGLPRWGILVWFPVLLVLLMLILVTFGISGSSTGMFWQMFGSGTDPNLLVGEPQWVRGDEWATQGSWIVSQASQGFPTGNRAFAGGIDAAGFFDLPVRDWTTILRPQTAGFLFLGLDRGLAWRWWFPAVAMMATCYLMFITLLPRRPLTSATVSVAVFFSPLVQWIFLPMVFWPTALCFVAIGATVFSVRDGRRWVQVVWAILTCWIAMCAALTLYPPFTIPGLLATIPICLGAFLLEARRNSLGLRSALERLVPFFVAALLSLLVLLTYVLLNAESLRGLTNTVYPGERVQATGSADFPNFIGIFSAPFADALAIRPTFPGYSGYLGPNAPSASTPVLVGLFLLIPLLWFVIRDWRKDHTVQWMMVACILSTGLIFAFLFVPGWDAVAHVLFLDRMTVPRSRIGLGMLSVVAIALMICRLDERDSSVPWAVTIVTTGVALLVVTSVWATLANHEDPALSTSRYYMLTAGLLIAAVLLYTRRKSLLASLCFLIMSMILTVAVNPLYRGMFDLTKTSAGKAVERINEGRPGSWVGIGNLYLSLVLVESGVQSFNGVQAYPERGMWQKVDASGVQEHEWNRYASLVWEDGTGDPTLQNPQDDLVVATFDSCSNFARDHVTYVMSDHPVDQTCLHQIDRVSQGPTTAWFYEVIG